MIELHADCRHNARCRYTSGFYCEDCGGFFHKDSPTYRSDELISTLWMVLHNINALRYQKKLEPYADVAELLDTIGIGKKHENYEEIITMAEVLMQKYGQNSESATRTLSA